MLSGANNYPIVVPKQPQGRMFVQLEIFNDAAAAATEFWIPPS